VATQGWFESDQDFIKRAQRENLEKTTGMRQGFFESEDDYIKRATKEALRKNTGLTQGFFESEDDYIKRANRTFLEKKSGTHQGFFESENAYLERASMAVLKQQSGLTQGWFESEESFRNRAMKELAAHPPHYRQNNALYYDQSMQTSNAPPTQYHYAQPLPRKKILNLPFPESYVVSAICAVLTFFLYRFMATHFTFEPVWVLLPVGIAAVVAGFFADSDGSAISATEGLGSAISWLYMIISTFIQDGVTLGNILLTPITLFFVVILAILPSATFAPPLFYIAHRIKKRCLNQKGKSVKPYEHLANTAAPQSRRASSSGSESSAVQGYMIIDDTCIIPGRGIVVTGLIHNAAFKKGQVVSVFESTHDTSWTKKFDVVVVGIEKDHKLLEQAEPGDVIGLLLRRTDSDIRENDIIAGNALLIMQ